MDSSHFRTEKGVYFLPDLVFIGRDQSLEGMSHLPKMLNSHVNRISIGFKSHFQKSIALN